jgi:Na+-transporting methylmalonyl-CoA/oxaloacetate decarboxylase gamma subunit
MQSLLQDGAMLLFTVVFFVLAFLYVKACQKLR